jgi:hypothetical protein
MQLLARLGCGGCLSEGGFHFMPLCATPFALAEPAVCKRASAVRLKRKETALGAALIYCELADPSLFVFFLRLHTTVFVRSFHFTKYNHLNVSEPLLLVGAECLIKGLPCFGELL